MAACSGGGGGGGNPSTCASSVVSVSIEPGAAAVVAGTTQPFVATVTGTANTTVTWSVQEGATGGTMSDTGVYTAPATPGTYHVVATSQADSCGSASVAVTVSPATPVTVTVDPPGPVDVEVGGGSLRFLATVTGTANTAVVWSVQANGAGGQINPVNGVYGAPPIIGVTNVDVVIATSVADPTKSAQAEVHVLASTPSALISPTEATVGLGGQLQLTLSRQIQPGGWMVDGAAGGNSTVGTINATGLYTAPFQIPAPTTMVNVTKTFASNSSAVTLASRFLPSETLQVDGCVSPCPNDTPNAIVAADFNGDGFSDLATANTGTGTVSLWISANAPHFAVPYWLWVGNPISGEPQALVVADINQDPTVRGPRLDLVIADADPSGLAVRTRLGVGNGMFGGEGVSALPLNSNPLSMAVGQFDSDGVLDVAVANYVTNAVDILQGRRDGTFQLLNTITAGLLGPLSIATADFNADGWDDLAVANNGSNTVSVFLSNGDGSFVPQFVQLGANSPSAVAVVSAPGTLNGDNYPDLVVATTAPDGGLTVIFNSAVPAYFADPRFIAPGPPIATGSLPVAVAIGNFNRDSVPDVVVANQGDDTVTTYFFDPANDVLVRSETYAVGQSPQALAVGDFNGDGWDDVAVANSDDDTVSILRNRGGPTTTSP
jgi:hypothetical protein